MARHRASLFDAGIVRRATRDAVAKLDPRRMVRNPVMFVVYVGSFVMTALYVQALAGRDEAPAGFILALAAWLWFTVLLERHRHLGPRGGGGRRRGRSPSCCSPPSCWSAR